MRNGYIFWLFLKFVFTILHTYFIAIVSARCSHTTLLLTILGAPTLDRRTVASVATSWQSAWTSSTT